MVALPPLAPPARAPSVRWLALGLLLASLLLAPPAGAQLERRPERFVPLRMGDPEVFGYEREFFPGAQHDPALPSPDALLGQPLGSRMARSAEIVAVMEALAQASPRVLLRRHGTTHEGRPLLHAVISSPDNLARLDAALADLARLADPRGLTDDEAQQVLERAVPVAYLGYSIHGDETSGADAALALAHHLAADTRRETAALLEQVIVVLDPSLNPDGRERILGLVEQGTGRAPVLDHDAMQRGRWPWGRGNHYLFDLNRDWMVGSQPETRARWAAIAGYHPQLFVDAHEMGELDTFLFYPQSQPHNPFLPQRLQHWQGAFAADQSATFDEQGWTYYTREWADAWGPFYSDAWGSLRGAVGMLYEQARTSGFALRGRAGVVRTYREAVHRQAASSLANVRTLAAHAREVLADFLAHKRANVSEDGPGGERMLVVLPGRHPTREGELLSLLVAQGVEVLRTSAHQLVRDVELADGRRLDRLDLPPGSLVVPARQPLRPLVMSYLAFDVPLPEEALREERLDLQRGEGSNLYDVTAWSLPLLFDLDAAWCAAEPVPGERVLVVEPPQGCIEPVPDPGRAVAWIVDGGDDAALAFAVRALEDGLVVHCADEPFRTGGRAFPRGSLLVHRAENRGDVETALLAATRAARVTVYATPTGRSPDEGPDLGGGHFRQLQRPRVALLSGMPVQPDTFGHLWNLLDVELGLPVAHLEAARLSWSDLRRYNVLVVPPAFGWGSALEENAEALSAWVRSGGTLVGIADGASALLGEALGLSQVVRREDVLDDLDTWLYAATREAGRRTVELDMEALWRRTPDGQTGAASPRAGKNAAGEGADASSGEGSAGDGTGATTSRRRADDGERSGDDGERSADDRIADEARDRGAAGADPSSDDGPPRDPEAARQDAWDARFSPSGAILRGLVDDRHWITAGCGDELPVLVDGPLVLYGGDPVSVPVRLAPPERLRMSGLLWPEARRRHAGAAWLTVERLGHGQLILFGAMPFHRAAFRSGGRLLGNAVVLGPGLGADAPVDW